MNSPLIHNRGVVKGGLHQKIIQNEKYRNAFRTPENLTIISYHNYNEKPVFEQNMDHLGISYKSYKVNETYYHTMKIEFMYNQIKNNKIDTEYVLVCDTDDVIFIDDPQKTVNIFNEYECDILFMSTNWDYPYDIAMPTQKEWVNKTMKQSRYLNGGVWIAKTKNILDILERVMEFIPEDKNELLGVEEYKQLRKKKRINEVLTKFPRGSHDQDIFRFIEPEFYPRLKVDYNNKLAWRN